MQAKMEGLFGRNNRAATPKKRDASRPQLAIGLQAETHDNLYGKLPPRD
jgi:hypothetical protein